MSPPVLFVKAHVKGYTRKDGVFVAAHQDKRTAKSYVEKVQGDLFGGGGKQAASSPVKKPEPPEGYHPKPNESGQMVGLRKLSAATALEAFDDPAQTATVVPGGAVPGALHGVAFAPWEDAPSTLHGWAEVAGQNAHEEAPPAVPKDQHLGAGVVVQEPDGRVWVCHPSNAFGGYKATFPKGTVEDGLSLQASAIKEAYEESGLQVELIRPLMDVPRTTSVARYYLAKRVGGSPAEVGWETQAMSLVPVEKLYDLLNMSSDHGLAEALGAVKSK